MTAAQRLLGIDLGSTTVKLAVLTSRRERTFQAVVRRHFGDIVGTTKALLAEFVPEQALSRVYLTGSASPLLAERFGIEQIHEVAALAGAIGTRHPRASSVFELGGQDSKALFLRQNTEFTMNDRCAAGTGVTIDRCLFRLGVSPEEAARFRYQSNPDQSLSSKCGVFAETDMLQLARRGVSNEVLFSLLMDSIVLGSLSVLARGQLPAPQVLLLGGPHHYYPALADAWRHHLEVLWKQQKTPIPTRLPTVVVPEHAVFYPALGSILAESDPKERREALNKKALLDHLHPPKIHSLPEQESVFATSNEEQAALLQWVSQHRIVAPIGIPEGPLTLGVDAGSTRTKFVILNERRELAASGNFPSQSPKSTLEKLYGLLKDKSLPLSGFEAIGITGYGAEQLAPLLGATRIVETVAHALGARHFCPTTDLVCDIGGQDFKLIALGTHGELRDFALSTQCTAGIGVAIESCARELGHSAEGFGLAAFQAKRVPHFGSTCAVFLDSNRVSFQRQGYAREEMLAGLLKALPRIVWDRVPAMNQSTSRSFLLQGGVLHDDVIALAQLQYLYRRFPEVRFKIHPFPSLAGAIGAALFALNEPSSKQPRPSATTNLTEFATEESPCTACANHCPRTLFTLGSNGNSHTVVTGNACPEGLLDATNKGKHHLRVVPKFLSAETRRYFSRLPSLVPVAKNKKIPAFGIPRVLGMYRAAPLFLGYLRALGVSSRMIELSPVTSSEMRLERLCIGATDPCYPVKLVYSHLRHLLRVHDTKQPLDFVLFPRITHAKTVVPLGLDCASCPVVVAAPSLVRSAFVDHSDEFSRRGITLIDAPFDLSNMEKTEEQCFTVFAPLLHCSREESRVAFRVAAAHARRLVLDSQRRILPLLSAPKAGGKRKGLVLFLGRPYQADPGVNHQLAEELSAMGYPCLGIRSLPTNQPFLENLEQQAQKQHPGAFDAIDQLLSQCDNSGSAERLWAARVAAAHGGLAVVDFSSFKCGQDATTLQSIQKLFAETGVPYCNLHEFDETRPRAAMRLRLETLHQAMQAKGLEPWL